MMCHIADYINVLALRSNPKQVEAGLQCYSKNTLGCLNFRNPVKHKQVISIDTNRLQATTVLTELI